jgi:hypothetical protein
VRGFRVYERRCDQCLMSSAKVVSDERRDAILSDVERRGSYFVCHKASIAGDDVCCRGTFDAGIGNLARIAERLGAVEFVPLPSSDRAGV